MGGRIDATGSRRLKAGHEAQHRALSASRRADQGHEFAWRDGERDRLQRAVPEAKVLSTAVSGITESGMAPTVPQAGSVPSGRDKVVTTSAKSGPRGRLVAGSGCNCSHLRGCRVGWKCLASNRRRPMAVRRQ